MNSFQDILLNRKTAGQLDAFLNRPAHGLLLSGAEGSGKSLISKMVASRVLDTPPDMMNSHPYFFMISRDDDKSEISIDAARQLIKKLSLRVVAEKNPGRAINRVAVIEDAGSMSIEAQNAILKLLEEPPEGSLIILTASSESALLPTVASRTQKISVGPVPLADSLEFFSKSQTAGDIETAWRLSQGLPGLLYALLSEASSHPLKKAVEQAKEMLKMDAYQRTIHLQKIAKDKAEFLTFAAALSKVLAALYEASLKNDRQANSAKLLRARELVSDTLASAETNTNTRLLALSLATGMPL